MSALSSTGSAVSQQLSRGASDRASVTLLRRALDHAELEGRAAVSLIESVGEVARPPASSGPAEPGLGRGVDVRA